MKGRFKIRRIGLQIPELPGLPFLFHVIPSRIEGVAMRVQMRIRNAVDWPRGEMDELRPNHVAGCSIFIRPVFPHPCFNFGFNLPHGLVHRHFERIQNPLILCELVSDRNRFWTMEIEIVAHRAIAFVPLRQPFICPRLFDCHTGNQNQPLSPLLTSPKLSAPMPCQSPLIS